jgi:hypothetical protein
MSVYIQSHIIAERIAPDAWQGLYAQTIELLTRCVPAPMGLRRIPGRSGNRLMLSRTIEHNVDELSRRHWHILGDVDSLETAESFELYADLHRYRLDAERLRRDEPPAPAEDILQLLLPDETDTEKCGLWNLFHAKTQGRPYHQAMLAVAMLIEDRFPLYAAVSGTIDRSQAEAARDLIRETLDQDVALPLCVDAEPLLSRISQYVQGEAALSCFDELFRGERTELFRIAEPRVLRAWLATELKQYESPTQIGVINLAIDWLNADGDLLTLCRLLCLDEAGPHFDPVGLAELLAATWVTIPEDKRSSLAPFRRPAGAPDTVFTQFGMAMLDMYGFSGRSIRRTIAREEVLALLVQLFPGQIDSIRATLDQCTAVTSAGLEQARVPVAALDQRSREEPETGDGRSFLEFVTADTLSDRQRELFEWLAYSARRLLQQLPEQLPQSDDWTLDTIKDMLERACESLGLTLTEEAWGWIDAEQERALLELLLVMAAMPSRERQFRNLRLALFERRAFAQAILAASADETLIAKVEAMVQQQASD